jgi:hypothetical protein
LQRRSVAGAEKAAASLPGLCGILAAHAGDRAPPADGFSDIKGFPSNSLN